MNMCSLSKDTFGTEPANTHKLKMGTIPHNLGELGVVCTGTGISEGFPLPTSNAQKQINHRESKPGKRTSQHQR